jgi:hypothetical protein
MEVARHVARMGDRKMHIKCQQENSWGRDNFLDPGIDGKIILK